MPKLRCANTIASSFFFGETILLDKLFFRLPEQLCLATWKQVFIHERKKETRFIVLAGCALLASHLLQKSQAGKENGFIRLMPPKLVVFVSFRPSTDVVDDNKSASKTKWKRKWEKEESSELKAGESDSLAGAEKCASRQVEIVSEYDFIVDFKDVEIKHFFFVSHPCRWPSNLQGIENSKRQQKFLSLWCCSAKVRTKWKSSLLWKFFNRKVLQIYLNTARTTTATMMTKTTMKKEMRKNARNQNRILNSFCTTSRCIGRERERGIAKAIKKTVLTSTITCCAKPGEDGRVSAACRLSHLACLVCVSSDCSTAHKMLPWNEYVRRSAAFFFGFNRLDFKCVCVQCCRLPGGWLRITFRRNVSFSLIARYLLLMFAQKQRRWWIFNVKCARKRRTFHQHSRNGSFNNSSTFV